MCFARQQIAASTQQQLQQPAPRAIDPPKVRSFGTGGEVRGVNTGEENTGEQPDIEVGRAFRRSKLSIRGALGI